MKKIWPYFLLIAFGLASIISGCSGEQPLEKAILGTWVQQTPTSMTAGGLQTTTSDTVLRLKKNGETHLTRNLDITGQGLPEIGISLNVDLKGKWDLLDGQLRQAPEAVMVMPRVSDDLNRKWADDFQDQAEKSPPSIKAIISADRKQLILQDTNTGATDVYSRK